jgi:hypothetical protein
MSSVKCHVLNKHWQVLPTPPGLYLYLVIIDRIQVQLNPLIIMITFQYLISIFPEIPYFLLK